MSIRRLTYIITTALLLAACKQDEDGVQPPVAEIHVSTMMADAETRTVNTTVQSTALDEGQTAGIYVFRNGATDISDEYGYKNLTYSYVNGQWKNSPIYFTGDHEAIDVFVYAPRIDASHTLENIPLSVQTDQSTTAGYLASDFVFGNTKNVSYNESGVNVDVKLYHALSKIILTIQDKDGKYEPLSHMKRVQIGTARFPVLTDAYVNITRNIASNADLTTNAAVTTGGTQGIVTLFDNNNETLDVSDTEPVKPITMCVILPPQTLSSAGNNLAITFSSGGSESVLTGTLATTIQAGYQYNYTIVADQEQLTIVGASIEPWVAGGEVTKLLTD